MVGEHEWRGAVRGGSAWPVSTSVAEGAHGR